MSCWAFPGFGHAMDVLLDITWVFLWGTEPAKKTPVLVLALCSAREEILVHSSDHTMKGKEIPWKNQRRAQV